MRWILIAISLLSGSLLSAHPLHLSITNISLDGREMKITMKTFVDDWEVAYFHYYSKVINFTDQQSICIPWFESYLEESFRISGEEDGEPFNLQCDTIIISEENMEIEMHAALQEELKSLYLYNTILTDIFPDQTNLVIIGYRNRETGIKFDIKTHAGKVILRKR